MMNDKLKILSPEKLIFIKRSMLLYAVTDRTWTQNLIADVEAALKGGVTCVQLREKNMPFSEFEAEALAVKALCEKYHVPFIVNDNVNLAARCGADGVHVGQDDMPLSEARALLGQDAIIGVSVRTLEQALAAERDGADYLGVGAIFPTSTKPDAVVIMPGDGESKCDHKDKSEDDETAPVRALRRICRAVKIPVVAIGGINATNMHKLSDTGVDGVAIVSAIFAAGSPEKITRRCRELRALNEKFRNRCK